MQTRWIGKGVDLNVLAEYAEEFLKRKGLNVQARRVGDKYEISGTVKEKDKLGLIVRISGNSNDFTVELVKNDRAGFYAKLGILVTFLGGGIFLQQFLKSQELIERVEREFWFFADETVAQLSAAKISQ